MQLVSIAAGRDHTCGIGTDSIAYCWGSRNPGRAVTDPCVWNGQPCSVTPQAVAGGQRFVALAEGRGRLDCGLAASGAAYCWGSLYAEDIGLWGSAVPEPLGTALQFSAIGSGLQHTCGLDLQGQVWCWGANYMGTLGTGAPWGPGPEYSLDPLLAGEGAAFTSIAVGGAHSCAKNEAGQLFCWGDNTTGQLGGGLSPVDHECNSAHWSRDGFCEASPRGVYGGFVFTAVSGGWDHTCGVTEGTLLCWGANGAGQLGATTSQYTCPVLRGGTQPCAPYPVRVGFPFASADMPVVAVATGEGHTCALTGAGTIYCWGRNDRGQLGIGAVGDRALPTPVALDGITFRALTAALDHTCALAANGDAYCWGNNSGGQLGDGTTVDRSAPVRVRRPAQGSASSSAH